MAWHEMYMARYLGVDVNALATWVGVSAKQTARAFGKSPVDLDKAVVYADRVTGETGGPVFPLQQSVTLQADSYSGLTVQQVLDEVGDDPVAAQAALDEELGSDKPRSTLVAQLEQIVDEG